MGFVIRELVENDEWILWEMVCHAAGVEVADGAAVAAVRAKPELCDCVADWGRAGDVGVLATFGAAELPVGAAWLRLGDVKPIIGIMPKFRGHGLEEKLVTALSDLAQSSDVIFVEVTPFEKLESLTISG